MVEYTKRAYGPQMGPLHCSKVGVGVDPSYLLHIKGTSSTDLPTYSAEFLDGDNWTSADWTGSWAAGWTHTTGNTTVLSHDHTAVNATKYQIAYTVTGRTDGSFTITFGGQTISAISATGTWGPVATSTGVLQITPTSAFDGTIVISIKSVTASSSPAVMFINSSGTPVCEIRSGYDNSSVLIGVDAGRVNTTGYYNVFIGRGAGYTNSTGYWNTFIGRDAGRLNNTGYGNTSLGSESGYNNSTGYRNVFIGQACGRTNTTGYYNTFIGVTAGYTNSSGYSNTFIGLEAGYLTSSGVNNTFIGVSAGRANSTGHYNTFIGVTAGRSNTTGSYNVFVGKDAGYNANQKVDAANSMGLGYSAFTTRDNQVVIGNESVVETQLRANVYLGSTSSTAHTQPTAKLHIAAGSATAGTAPIKLTSGTVNTSPEAGAIEFDGSNFYFTI